MRQDHTTRRRRLATLTTIAATTLAIPATATAEPFTGLDVTGGSNGPTIQITGATAPDAWASGEVVVTAQATPASASDPVWNTVCQVDNGQAQTLEGAQQHVPVTGDGVHLVSCYPVSASGVVGATVWATVQIDDQKPTVQLAGAPTEPTWLRGTQTVTAQASETQELSGVASVSCSDGAGNTNTISGTTGSVNVTQTGQWTVSCWATTAAGVSGPASSETIWEDNAAPTVTYSNAPDPNKYYDQGQPATITATAQAPGADIQSLTCDYAGQPVLNGQLTETAPSTLHTWSVQTTLPGPDSGTLTCQTSDSAGNQSQAATLTQKIDTTPPQASFVNDPASPGQIYADVSDDESGVAGAQIQYEQAGKWINLPTTLTGGTAVAAIPAQTTLPHGTYPLEITVTDGADNTATYTKDSNGQPAELTWPTAARLTLPYTIAVHGRAPDGTPAANTTGNSNLQLGYGQTATITGRFATTAFADLAGNTLFVTSTPVGKTKRAVTHTTVTTTKAGRWHYRIPAGGMRRITVSYPGTTSVAHAAFTVAVEAPGQARLTAAHARAHGTTAVRVHADGGAIPANGLQLHLRYRDSAQDKWEKLGRGTYRTNAAGTLATAVATPPARAGQKLQLQARIPHTNDWSYDETYSSIATVNVAKAVPPPTPPKPSATPIKPAKPSKPLAHLTLIADQLKHGVWALVGVTGHPAEIPANGLPITLRWRTGSTSAWRKLAVQTLPHDGLLHHWGVPVPPVAAGQKVQLQVTANARHGWRYTGGGQSNLVTKTVQR